MRNGCVCVCVCACVHSAARYTWKRDSCERKIKDCAKKVLECWVMFEARNTHQTHDSFRNYDVWILRQQPTRDLVIVPRVAPLCVVRAHTAAPSVATVRRISWDLIILSLFQFASISICDLSRREETNYRFDQNGSAVSGETLIKPHIETKYRRFIRENVCLKRHKVSTQSERPHTMHAITILEA